MHSFVDGTACGMVYGGGDAVTAETRHAAVLALIMAWPHDVIVELLSSKPQETFCPICR